MISWNAKAFRFILHCLCCQTLLPVWIYRQRNRRRGYVFPSVPVRYPVIAGWSRRAGILQKYSLRSRLDSNVHSALPNALSAVACAIWKWRWIPVVRRAWGYDLTMGIFANNSRGTRTLCGSGERPRSQWCSCSFFSENKFDSTTHTTN